jgi:hypothetical protein
VLSPSVGSRHCHRRCRWSRASVTISEWKSDAATILIVRVGSSVGRGKITTYGVGGGAIPSIVVGFERASIGGHDARMVVVTRLVWVAVTTGRVHVVGQGGGGQLANESVNK